MRSGIIAKKMGMTRIFNDDGQQIPVTVLRLEKLQVVAQKTVDKDGYFAVKLGAGSVKAKNCNKSLRGQFSISKVEPKRKLKEFRVSQDNLIDIGKEINASHYVEGQYVDVSGLSIGKGFAGAMKRHNFSGLRASHGVSISHRSHGSTGQCQDPGRVFKGKKMAGHMGDCNVTIQNLRVVKTDPEKGIILIKGAVPGAKGGWVTLKDSIKKKLPDNIPFPTANKQKTESTINNLSINNPGTSENNNSDNQNKIENEVAETSTSESSNIKNDNMDQKNEN